jgi:DNA-directed RNA polymerase subunit RPC12/RpoP
MKDMGFPIKTCIICGEEFELKPGKPGFANRCPSCSEPEEVKENTTESSDLVERQTESELNAARRRAMRELLYRKES